MSKFAKLFQPTDTDIDLNAPEMDQQFNLLFVDDEEGVLQSLRRIFLDENYRILTASSAGRALETMENEKIHLVITDHRMPGMTGAELLKEIRLKWPETIRIMLTGYADVQSIMGAVKDGAVYKFITKPWNDEDLRLTVSLALQQYVLIRENSKLNELARTQQQKIKKYAGLLDETRESLGPLLVKAGIVTHDHVEAARKEKADGESLSEALVRMQATTEDKIVKALQSQLHVDHVDLKEMEISTSAVRYLPRELCEKRRMIPVKLDGRQITLAIADPSDHVMLDNLSFMTGLKVVPLVATGSEILAQLHKAYEGKGDAEDYFDFSEPLDEIDIVIEDEDMEINMEEMIGASEVPPVIRIVNAIISEAIRYRASDIHIEPKLKHTLIRYRLDGMLHCKIKTPAELHPAIISRVKILSKMDIAERRRPQDGRITVKTGSRIVDLRVSSMPTIGGEKMVMRILDKNASIKKLEDLGVLAEDMKKINVLIRKPQGVIIATGPTGSGKTTFLYSVLHAMLESTKNFETIEEPVEYFLEDASQVAVREKIGLSFAQILRATLRQDPDVILVGEIRDYETADVAFKASLTGHMVLSTLHTNSSVASITRLIDMGIKPYIIASALEAIVAQRLVRKVCRNCRTEVPPDREIIGLLRVPERDVGKTVFIGKGCDKCNHTGYSGRIGIFEVFCINNEFRHFITSNYKERELVEMAHAEGMKTLIEDGMQKVRQGYTTLEELLRVIGPQAAHERCCSNCNHVIDAKFLFCPYCGAFRQNCCTSCKSPLEEDWLNCPFCGKSRLDGKGN